MRETIQNTNGKQFHAVSLSGGKDSTAMLLLMIERGMSIDMVLSADTGMEFPEMYAHPCQTRTITPPRRKLMSMPITRLRWMSYPRKRPPFLPWMSAWSRCMTGQRQSTAASERSRRFGST